jgi:hypothetical protein
VVTVKLTVTDAAGAAAHMSLPITVQAPFVATTSAIVYSSLAFVVGIAIAIAVLTLVARRKKKGPATTPPELMPPRM